MKFVKKTTSVFAVIIGLNAFNVAHAAEFCTLATAALQKNHSLSAVRHQLSASKEKIFQSQNMNGPKLDLLANLSAYTAQQGSSEIDTNGTLAIKYSQTLFDNGYNKALTEQATSNSKMVGLELAVNSQKTILEIATNYVQYLQNTQLLMLHRSNMTTTNKQLQITKDKFDASAATQQELSLVESRVRQAMSAMLRAKSQVILSRVRLISLTNKTPRGTDIRFLQNLINKMPKNIRSAIATAQKNSIEVGQTNIAIDSANAEVSAQKALLGPKLQISGNFGIGKIGANKGAAGQVGLDFSMPLYNGDVLNSKVREAKAMLAAARARRAYAVEMSKQTVVASYEISKSINQSILILPEAIKAEEEAIRSLEESIASSFISISELLLVKNSLFELKKGLINLRFERYLANVNLLNSLGYLKSMNSVKKRGLCR